MTFQSQLSDSVVDRGMDSGIEASDGLRVDDSKLRVQSILVQKNLAFFTVKLEYPFLVEVENDNEYTHRQVFK